MSDIIWMIYTCTNCDEQYIDEYVVEFCIHCGCKELTEREKDGD